MSPLWNQPDILRQDEHKDIYIYIKYLHSKWLSRPGGTGSTLSEQKELLTEVKYVKP